MSSFPIQKMFLFIQNRYSIIECIFLRKQIMCETPQQLHNFSASPQNPHATSFGSLPHMVTQKHFLPHPTAHIFGPWIHHGKFVVALQPQFPFFYASLLALLWISDRYASLLHHSSLSFLVYCCFFWFSTLFLTGLHQFLLCPPHFITIYTHGSI